MTVESTSSQLMDVFRVEELPDAECEKHGTYTPKLMRLGGREIVSNCEACEQERREAEEAKERRERDEDMQRRRMANAGIPPRFEHAELETYKPGSEQAERVLAQCSEYVGRWQEVVEQGRSAVLCGKVGTGKTHLAVGILKTVVRGGYPGCYTTAIDLCRSIKSTWGAHAEKREEEVIARYAQVSLLVIDEIGVQFGSDTERLMLFDVIDQRYRQMLPTILVSNLTLAQMVDVLGERVIDRMRENGGMVLPFVWDSHRGTRAAK